MFFVKVAHAFLVLRVVGVSLPVLGGGLLATAVTMLYGQRIATQVV